MMCSSNNCQKEAKFVCLCDKNLFCPKHIGFHMSQPGDHNSEPLNINLNSSDSKLLKQEIQKRIIYIEKSKIQIVSLTAGLVKELEMYCKQALNKLDKLYQFYFRLLKLQSFSKSLKLEANSVINYSLKVKEVIIHADNFKEAFTFNLISFNNIEERVSKSNLYENETEFKIMKNKIFVCCICYISKPYEKFVFFMACGCEICRNCLNNHLKYCISNIESIPIAGCCPLCSREINPRQLESLFSPEDWNKYDAFLFQIKYAKINTCPSCKRQLNSGMSRCAVCPNIDCNYKYCKQCEEDYHKDGDCEEVFIQGRIESLKNEEGGVTQCPRCRLPYIKDPINYEKVTCINSGCGIRFCFNCACILAPVYEHGNHYHRQNCKFFSTYDGMHDFFSERCSECKKLGKLCKPPKLLKTPRLVAKDEVE